MRRFHPASTLGLAALLATLAGGCARTIPPGPDASSAGQEAIDASRAMSDPDDESAATDNSGTWGGVQAPNISDAPRLQLPPSRVPGL